MTVLRATGLTITAGTRRLLQDGAVSLAAGELGVVVGATGCGKSVLLRALCGLHPCTGTIAVGDVDNMQHGMDAVRARLGVLLSNAGLLDDWTVFDNVAHRLRRQGLDEATVKTRVEQALADVGLQASARLLPAALSGGMQRRAALARALVHTPPCLLLDDPTAGLDPITSHGVLDLILTAARARGAALLLTTHDLRGVAARADQVWLMANGALTPLPAQVETLARELGA